MSLEIPADQYLDINDTKMRFWTIGESESPVILLHGLGCYIEYRRDNISFLAKRHQVIAIDLPGFGHSDKPLVELTIPYLRDFLRQFMGHEGIDRATLIGESMGGAIALQFAIEYPQRVEKLVLAGSSGLGREMSILLRVMTLPMIGEMAARPSRSGTAMLLRHLFHNQGLVTDERIDEALEMSMLPGSQQCLLGALRSMCNIRGTRNEIYQPILGALERINSPTLIIWGAQDRILPVEHGQRAARMLPDARLHIIDQCGHMPNVEHPKVFNTLVSDFLAE